jgi:hypothetical protein
MSKKQLLSLAVVILVIMGAIGLYRYFHKNPTTTIPPSTITDATLVEPEKSTKNPNITCTGMINSNVECVDVKG